MGKRRKPGAAGFAASSKLGRFGSRSAGSSVPSSKQSSLPRTAAPIAAVVDVQEVQISPVVETNPTVQPELDSPNLTDTSPRSTVAGPSSSASPLSENPLEDPIKAAKVAAPPLMSARIQESSTLQELGTPTTHVSGAPFVLIPDENIVAAKEEFKEFIFARFPGDIPSMGRLIGVVNAIWARTGPRIFVHKIGEGTFLLKVANERTREHLLSRQAWMIKGCPMFVAAWSPEFTPEQPQLTSAVIPVELRGVPYLLFNRQSLSRIATAVGKPVSLAPETERKENFEVAKIWVQVNLLESLPDKIVSGFSNGREVQISVSYPWLPEKCTTCRKFGHNHQICPSSGQKQWRPTAAAAPRRSASPSGHSQSRESQGRRRSRPGRSVRERRRVQSRERASSADATVGIACMQDTSAGLDQICQSPEPSHVMNDTEELLQVPVEVIEGNGELVPQLATVLPDSQEPKPKPEVSLDRNLGFSTVHVFHKNDGSAASLDEADDPNDPFFLVPNRKSSRKATKS
ncbi:unnamed protein product [Brassica napus]|uniref:DUF4283 domain-containing protein n=2 Tax=Brassica TaxID=3705 RepID=M4CA52_BRACM|nr:unnamed protein product [Brassica napus]